MRNNEVIIYSQESCMNCIQLKAWLKRHSIQFIEKDINIKSNFDELHSLGHNAVPLTSIYKPITNETIEILGFNKSKLKETLNITES